MHPRLADLAGARVAIWGFAREGRSALAALQRYFPTKPVTVFCSAAEAASISSGHDAIAMVTTAPDVDALRAFDVVIKSPGISPYRQPAASALRAGVGFTSASAIWFAEHPHARTICVTGTKGKSTVTALIAHLLRASGRVVALAGNIGLPLLELLAPPREPDWWVIELSSFQTHDFGGAPRVAVVNNLYEEHLDWHGTRDRYRADKLAIATEARALVVNAQADLLAATHSHPARVVFGTPDGWHVADGMIRRGDEDVLAVARIPLPGLHNAQNACAAFAAIEAAGMDARAVAPHVATFRALPHRLQPLGANAGIEYVNDSISTTPYAAIEALRSVAGRDAVILVGGFDRGVDWRPFADFVRAQPPRAIVTMGANGPAVAALLQPQADRFELAQAQSLAEAVRIAQRLVPERGMIVLSPGAPSFDQFTDYAERGREFARLGGFDPATISQVQGLGIA